jgi:hypothetical protein
MIYESSKDYGTGEILMIHDGETTVQEVCDYLQRNHSQEVNEGDQLHFTDASDNHGMTNPATINFSPANNTNEERERIANDALFGGWREVPKAEWDAWVESRGADTLVNNCSEPPTLQARLHGEVIAIAKLYDGSNYHGGKSPKYLLPNASRLASADPETPNP